MKKYILTIAFIAISLNIFAQVPYFGTTAGKQELYTYIQYKAHPGNNNQGAYMSYAFGLNDRLDFVGNFNASTGFSSAAYGLKANLVKQSWMKLGVQSWADFDIRDNFKCTDLNTGLFINGMITKKFGYCSNTWWTWSKGGDHDWDQWSYLSYDIVPTFTVMAGATTHFSDDFKTQPVLGIYFPFYKTTCYIWSTNWINGEKPRAVIGFDYKF